MGFFSEPFFWTPGHNSLTGNGVKGTLEAGALYFSADGIPVVPIYNSGVKDLYQQATVTMKDATAKIGATTKATFQKSDEINCAKFHGHGTSFARLDTEARMHANGKIRVVILLEYLIDFSKI